MKRKSLLLILLMLIGLSTAWAEEIQIGYQSPGRLTNQFPTNPYFNYSLTQQIYTASEIGKAGSITSISFYRDWNDVSIEELYMAKLQVFMKHTSKSKFDHEEDMVQVYDEDKVWAGIFTAPAWDYRGWVTITLDRPFEYNGTDNMLLCFYDCDSRHSNSTNKFYYVSTDEPRGVTYYSVDVEPDLGNINNFSSNKALFYAHNWIKLNIEDASSCGVVDKESTPNFPTKSNYNYSLTQQIYTKSELGESKTINSIGFYSVDVTRTRKVDLYLVQTDKISFDDENDWIPYSDADKVFSGTVTFNNGMWTNIELDVPFNYVNTQHLAVIMDDNSNYYQSAISFLCCETDNSQSLLAYDDNKNIDLSNVSSVLHERSNKRNIMQINDIVSVGSYRSTCLPTNPYYNYSVSQQIYSAAEIGGAKALSSISFKNTGPDVTRDIDVYLVHTDKAFFANNYDWIPFSADDKVFSGEVTFKENEWTAIRFSDYFHYNGSGNLAVIVDDNTNDWTSTYRPFLAVKSPQSALYLMSDGTDYGTDNFLTDPGYRVDVKNQILFNEAGLSGNPTSICVSDIQWDRVNISWTGRGFLWYIQFKPENEEEWQDRGPVCDQTYKLSDLEQETTYDVRVRGSYYKEYTEWVTTKFTTSEHYPKPTDIEALELSPFSAILNWKENSGATSWQVSANGVVSEGAKKPFVLTGLEQGTEYEIMVRSIIDAENEVYSNWSYPVSITTPEMNPAPYDIAVTTSPTTASINWEGGSDSYEVRYRKSAEPFYFEGFEGISDGKLPEGWTTVDADGDGKDWVLASSEGIFICHSGSDCAVSASYDAYTSNALTPDNWLITPQLELKGTLKAWLRGQDSFDNEEHFAIYVSTAGTDVTDFVEVLPESVTSGEYELYLVDLSAYEGKQGYIAFRHFNVADKFYLNLDDIGLYVETEWTTIETTDKKVTIEGLEPDTEYEFEVVGKMSYQKDAPSGVNVFTTMVKNPTPFDLVVNSAATTADVSWEGYSNMYIVQYRAVESIDFYEDFESGLGDWTTIRNGEGITATDWQLCDDATYVYDGSYCAMSGSWDSESGNSFHVDNWLISPKVYLGGMLRFWAKCGNSDYPENFQVAISTSGNSISDFESVYAGACESSIYHEVAIDLSAYEGKQGYVAIRHTDYDKTHLFIDNLSIFGEKVGNWSSKWTSEKEYTLTDLKPNTRYDVQVIGLLSGEPDAASEIVPFITALYDPTEIALDNKDYNKGTIDTNVGVYANVTIHNLTLRKDGTWQSIVLPFDVNVDGSVLKGADVRSFESVTKTDDVAILNFSSYPLSTMYAGCPYIIRWNGGEDIVDPVFKGVMIESSLNMVEVDNCRYTFDKYNYYMCSGDYPGFYYLTGSPKLSPLVDQSELDAFTGYFDMTSGVYSEMKAFVIYTGEEDDVITGISRLGETGEEIIYNVAGQRLSKKQRGVNIVNGKKILVK